jgi:hypothetical protein
VVIESARKAYGERSINKSLGNAKAPSALDVGGFTGCGALQGELHDYMISPSNFVEADY